jgi:hypothetical protein
LDQYSGVMSRAALIGAVVADQSAAAQGAVSPGLEHVAGDRGITDLHHVGLNPFELNPLIRSIEVLLLKAGQDDFL